MTATIAAQQAAEVLTINTQANANAKKVELTGAATATAEASRIKADAELHITLRTAENTAKATILTADADKQAHELRAQGLKAYDQTGQQIQLMESQARVIRRHATWLKLESHGSRFREYDDHVVKQGSAEFLCCSCSSWVGVLTNLWRLLNLRKLLFVELLKASLAYWANSPPTDGGLICPWLSCYHLGLMEFNMKHVLLAGLCLVLLTACKHDVPFAYKMDIQQGNILKPEKVDQIKVGMTQTQVDEILGKLSISRDTFQQNRWDYVYYLKKNHKPVDEQRLTLYFNADGVVQRVVSSPAAVVPPSGPTPVADKSLNDLPCSATVSRVTGRPNIPTD